MGAEGGAEDGGIVGLEQAGDAHEPVGFVEEPDAAALAGGGMCPIERIPTPCQPPSSSNRAKSRTSSAFAECICAASSHNAVSTASASVVSPAMSQV